MPFLGQVLPHMEQGVVNVQLRLVQVKLLLPSGDIFDVEPQKKFILHQLIEAQVCLHHSPVVLLAELDGNQGKGRIEVGRLYKQE